ncbi:hypothetical protein ACWDE9_39055 [Streptomyces olivaceoviridis]
MVDEDPAGEAPTAVPGTDDEQDRQEYFEQLASVKDSILEGVITHW